MIICSAKGNPQKDTPRIPQMDGAFDSPIKKPTTRRGSRARTPSRRESRFAPLNITIYKSPNIGTTNNKENINDSHPTEDNKAVYDNFKYLIQNGKW